MTERLLIKGGVTSDELAALVTVLASIHPQPRPQPEPTSAWASPYRTLRPRTGLPRGGWRASARPD